jgi:RNA polymerase sigma-70 factor (ECF subfamily)
MDDVISGTVLDRERSFGSLCLPYAKALHRVALRLGGHDEAPDLVQETFLRAWESFARLRDPTRARPWLFQILRRLALGRLRCGHRRRVLMPTSPLGTDAIDSASAEQGSPLDRLLTEATQTEVLHAVRRLPPHYAVVVEQRDLVGLRYRDVAENLAIPIGTVMSRLNTGRRLLGTMLSESPERRAA